MNNPAPGPSRLSRRRFLSVSAAALGSAALLGACAESAPKETQPPAGTPGGGKFPVTVEDGFGQVTIDKAPSRVLSLGRTDHDVLLALGIVPVGVHQFVPQMTRGVGVWAEKALGGSTPKFFRPPVNFEQVGNLEPDLIVNVQSQGKEDEYRTLSGITTTVGLPKGVKPNQVSWRQSTELISKAVGKEAEGKALITATEERLRKAAQDNPSFKDRTVSILLAYAGKVGVYTPNDTRMQVVTALGLVPSPFVKGLGTNDYFVDVSAETLANANADVVIVLSQQGMPMKDAFAQYPQIARMAANAEGRMVYPEDPNVGLALSAASVLSIPYAVDALVPLIKQKLR
ncbi:ABC transporter substrate-binding protein [Crossiella sp. CA198]|uniref:ABC transporter substrate-binding protein n=1 Tax=Crossiella sp. CA198 TaxID=3455607 RepID=UPI003F8D29B0